MPTMTHRVIWRKFTFSQRKPLEPLLTWFEFSLQLSICPDFNNLSHRLKKKNHLQLPKFASAWRKSTRKCLERIKMQTSMLGHTEYELKYATFFKWEFSEEQWSSFLKSVVFTELQDPWVIQGSMWGERSMGREIRKLLLWGRRDWGNAVCIRQDSFPLFMSVAFTS